MSKATRSLRWQIKRVVKKIFRISDNYEFLPAPSIRKQRMEVGWRENVLIFEAGYTTPLYESIVEIIDHDCYQLKNFVFSGSGDTIVVDVGANVGVSVMALSVMHPGRIICFEPIEENCVHLRNNILLNNRTNIEIVQKAVTQTNGRVKFFMDTEMSVSGHAGEKTEHDSSKGFEVDSINLKSIIESLQGKTIELMKIDCEGGEYDIIDQVDPAVSMQIKALTLEIHDLDDERNARRIKRQLERLGYKITMRDETFGRSNLHHLIAVKK